MADAEAVWNELRGAEHADERARLEEEEARVLAEALAVMGPDRVVAADESTPAATLAATRDALEDVALSGARVAELNATLAELVPGAGAGGDVALTMADRWLAAVREERGPAGRCWRANATNWLPSSRRSRPPLRRLTAMRIEKLPTRPRRRWPRPSAMPPRPGPAPTPLPNWPDSSPATRRAARATQAARAAQAAADLAAARARISSLEAELSEAVTARDVARATAMVGLDVRIADLQSSLEERTAALIEARAERARTAGAAEVEVARLAALEEETKAASLQPGASPEVEPSAKAVALVADAGRLAAEARTAAGRAGHRRRVRCRACRGRRGALAGPSGRSPRDGARGCARRP